MFSCPQPVLIFLFFSIPLLTSAAFMCMMESVLQTNLLCFYLMVLSFPVCA